MDVLPFGTLALTPGSLGGQAFISNKKNLHIYPYSADMMQDSFIHLLAAGEFAFTTGCSFTLASAPCCHLLYIYEGALTLTVDGISMHGASEHVLFFCALDQIRYELPPGKCRFFQACLAGDALNRYAKLIPQDMHYPEAAAGASCLFSSIPLLLAPENASSDVQTVLLSKRLNDVLTELCLYSADTARKKDQLPDYMLQMKQLFDTGYQETITLEDLEVRFDKSRYRLCREFSHYYGQSPLQYLNHRRIEQAKRLLLTTSLPVHEVGSQVGIDNTSHFINLFKRKTGATPLVFKQEAPVAISELHYPCTPDVRPQ